MIEKGKIELKHPYDKDWKFGYIVINKEPRRNVVLYLSPKERSTVSYARYLYEVNIGAYLPKDVHVDHINGNKLDDRLENYQLLSARENSIKQIKQNNKTQLMAEFICGNCGIVFSKRKNNTHLIKIKFNSTYCSRECGGSHLSPSIFIREFRI